MYEFISVRRYFHSKVCVNFCTFRFDLDLVSNVRSNDFVLSCWPEKGLMKPKHVAKTMCY